MNNDLNLPRCPECGGKVLLLPGKNRTRDLELNQSHPIPDGFKIPTCSKCGEEYMIPEISEILDALLLKKFIYVAIPNANWYLAKFFSSKEAAVNWLDKLAKDITTCGFMDETGFNRMWEIKKIPLED